MNGYILPIHDKWSSDADKSRVDKNIYLEGSAVYIMKKDERTRPTRALIFSSGEMGPRWALGTHHSLIHDQLCTHLGHYWVVGIAYYDDQGEMMYMETDDSIEDKHFEFLMSAAVFK